MAENREEFVKFFQSLAPEKREELRKSYEEYGFGDLAKDLAKGWYKWRKEQKNWGEMSEDEKLEFASQFADVPGVLKPMALAKVLKQAGEFRLLGEFVTPDVVKHFTALTKVPSQEFARVRGVYLEPNLPSHVAGRFVNTLQDILLNPRLANKSTAVHEFVHARQWAPEADLFERLQTLYMRGLRQALHQEKKWSRFFDPTEVHASGVARSVIKHGEAFSDAFRRLLREPKTVASGEEVFRLAGREKFLQELARVADRAASRGMKPTDVELYEVAKFMERSAK